MKLPLLTMFGLGVLMFLAANIALTADPAPATKPSSYAPAADLVAQVKMYLERIESDLSDPSAYEEEQQQRVAKEANTLAVLGTLLGLHDEDHELKPGAAALVAAAKIIADNYEDHAEASAGLKKAQAAVELKSGGGKLGWEGVADMAQIMKQVPIVNNSLRQGVMGTRFARLKEKTAATAATLAALGEASAHDDSYAADSEEFEKWQQISFEMRDASADVAKATRAGDQDLANKHLDRLVKTCDDCHHAFRD